MAMFQFNPSSEPAMEDQEDLSFTTRLALARVQDSKKSFPFEKLPPETRNRIYDYLLINEDSYIPMQLRSGQGGLQYGLKPRSRSRACFSMLFLNKAIHREASSFLYGANAFHFDISWRRSGGPYFERDIGSVSAFFSGLKSTAQFIRKVHVLCDAKTLVSPAWAALCEDLDSQLHLKEFSLKIDLYETYRPLKGNRPVTFLILNYLLEETLLWFSSLEKPMFHCGSTPAICKEWLCPLDLDLKQDVELDVLFKNYLAKSGSTTLW